MDVERTMEAVELYTDPTFPVSGPYTQALVDAAEFALEVLGAGCVQWEEGVCGGRLVDGLCGTHQPTEPIPLPDWVKISDHI